MEPVEQVFLHIKTHEDSRSAEILGATEFVRPHDLAEIVGWFSELRSKSQIRFDSLNLFFHPLPSGDFAIGIIFPTQQSLFSFLKPPKSFFVRILVVSPSTFLLYGNHPIRLYEDFQRRGKIPLVTRPPKRLFPLIPTRNNDVLDKNTLENLADDPGPALIGNLVQSALDSVCTLFSGVPSSLAVLSGLLDLFPIRFRPELTFASEFFFSFDNPLRLVGISGTSNRTAGQARFFGVPFFLLTKNAPIEKGAQPLVYSPWVRFISELLQTRRFDFWETRLKDEMHFLNSCVKAESTPAGNQEELHGCAAVWIQELNGKQASRFSSFRELESSEAFEVHRCVAAVDQLLPLLDRERGKNRDVTENHFSLPGSGLPEQQVSSIPSLTPPGQEEFPTDPVSSLPFKEQKERSLRFPEFKHLFTELDSCMARAVFGDSAVLPRLQSVWHEVSSTLPWSERDRIQEECLELIRSILLQQPVGDQSRPAHRSARLLELLLVFLEKH